MRRWILAAVIALSGLLLTACPENGGGGGGGWSDDDRQPVGSHMTGGDVIVLVP